MTNTLGWGEGNAVSTLTLQTTYHLVMLVLHFTHNF